MVNGAVTGGATGGLLGVAGSATTSVANPVARHVVDTAGETAVDTIVDASQGGQVTPDSIATSLAINTLSEEFQPEELKVLRQMCRRTNLEVLLNQVLFRWYVA